MSRFTKQLILGTLATIATLPSFLATSAQATPSCQCTTYVANKFGLQRNFPNAADWNDGYLQRNGFVRVNPQAGAIAVMERNFPGSNTTFGHVGVVETLNNGRMGLRGANQWSGSNIFTENNCNNVRVTNFGTNVNGDSRISFWKRR